MSFKKSQNIVITIRFIMTSKSPSLARANQFFWPTWGKRIYVFEWRNWAIWRL